MKALALDRARSRTAKQERANRAARRAIARESRRADRRRGKRPNLANGFTPDLLDGIWETVVAAADRLQTAIINLTTSEALKKKPNKATHQTKLRKTVMAGVAVMAAEADKVERDARHLGRATATHIIDQAPQIPTDAQLRAARHMPKMPRNMELGTTVRTPKSLRQSVQDMAPTLYGTGSHLFDDIVNRIAAAPPESDTARRRIAQQVLNEYKQRGITGFVDKAGRRWNMVSYVEMATRTAASELAARAHLDELQRAGIDVVRYTVMPNCHPWCKPFQGRLLSITGMTRGTYYGEKIVCSVPEAIARGARHPNAVLGDEQAIDTYGEPLAGSKGTYSGPAVTVRTSKGHQLTVSPEHPIFTRRGWFTAQSLAVGDYVAYDANSKRGLRSAEVKSDYNNMKPTTKEVFDALKMGGSSTRVAAAGHYFNDDRKFLKGEIDIVDTEAFLPDVPDPQVVQDTGQVIFVRPGIRDGQFARLRPTEDALTRQSLPLDVGRALPYINASGNQRATDSAIRNAVRSGQFLTGYARKVLPLKGGNIDFFAEPKLDTGLNESMSNSRRGDSQDAGTVGLAVPGGIEFDQVVSVDIVQFSGHAYDFQTTEGVYAVGGIITHNCRHSFRAHLPGMTAPDPDTIDPGDYKATQQLRALEREIRREKRTRDTALTPEARAAANRNIQALQKQVREHVAATGIPRNRWREQVAHAL